MKTTDNYKKLTTSNPLHKFLINNFLKTLINEAEKLEISTVLDVGCGEGFTLSRLTEANIGKKREGIEYLDTAIELGKKEHPSVKIKKGTIYDLPYKDNAIDLVICTEVLEHLEDPEKALSELVRVSKKYCLLSVPHEPVFILSNFIRGKNWSRLGNDIEHINHWSRKGFIKFIRTQIPIVKVRNPFPWTLVLASKI